MASPLRVIALTHRVPYPPDRGDKIRTYHLLSRLARRAEVHLLCLADPPSDQTYWAALERMFASVSIVPLHMSTQCIRALPYLATSQPLTLPIFHHPRLAAKLAERIAAVRPHALYAESSSMAPYALRHPHTPLAMDFVDVDSAKWRAYTRQRGALLAPLYAREAWALARYERRVARHACVSLFAARRELALFRAIAPNARARVIENGVDVDYYAPRTSPPREPSVVFFGAMDYAANAAAAVYLVRTVLPRLRASVPELRVVLAGARPGREVRALASVPGVNVTGFVQDIRPHVTQCTLTACPLRVARGVQNKILEAMAMGVPVVASPEAAEGIEADADKELVVAPSDTSGVVFANAVLSLLADPDRCESLRHRARARVVARYDWQQRADELYGALRELASRERRRD